MSRILLIAISCLLLAACASARYDHSDGIDQNTANAMTGALRGLK